MRDQDLRLRSAQLGPALSRRLVDEFEAFESQLRAADPARDERADENREDEAERDGQARVVDQHVRPVIARKKPPAPADRAINSDRV